jgi:two-component system, sensor histidine kinase and response regulator
MNANRLRTSFAIKSLAFQVVGFGLILALVGVLQYRSIRFAYLMFTLAGMLLAFFSLQYLLITRGFQRRLKSLTRTAKRFGMGDLAARSDISHSDESGQIARAFDDMAQQIQLISDAARAEIAECKLAQAALLESEARHRSLLENIPDVTWTCGSKGQTIFISPNIVKVYGFTAEEIYQNGKQLWLDRVHPDDLEPVLAAFESLFVKGTQYDVEYRIKRADGRWIWVHDRAVATHKEDGQVYADGIFTDITERKRVETERVLLLAQVESQSGRLKDIVANVPGVVWETWGELDQTRQHIDFVSEHIEKLLGYTTEEWLATPNFWLQIVHPQDKKRAAAECFAIYISCEGGTSQFRWVTKDGRVLWVEAHIAVVCDETGTPIAMRGVTMDITERKRIEAAIRQSEIKYRTLFNQVADPVLIFERETGRILDCNAAVHRVYGYPLDTLKTMSVVDLHPPDERDEARLWVDQKHSGQVHGYRHMAKDGRQMDVEVISDEIEYQGHAAWISIIRDITARKQIEAELERARDTALESVHLKSEFIANIGHELRTPMNGILGMAELTLATDIDDEQREYLTLLLSAGHTLLTLINNIIDYSSIESNQLVVSASEFYLRSSVTDVIRRHAGSAQEKNLEMAFQVAGDVPDGLIGDAKCLSQIIENLLENAIKFTPSGEVAVGIITEAFSDCQATLHFSISDTGIGIPAEKQAIIFEAFTQADGSASRRYGGTGLGLAISARLVAALGGRIWVESEVGHGSTFHFTLTYDLQPNPIILGAADASLTILCGRREFVKDNSESLSSLTVEDQLIN